LGTEALAKVSDPPVVAVCRSGGVKYPTNEAIGYLTNTGELHAHGPAAGAIFDGYFGNSPGIVIFA